MSSEIWSKPCAGMSGNGNACASGRTSLGRLRDSEGIFKVGSSSIGFDENAIHTSGNTHLAKSGEALHQFSSRSPAWNSEEYLGGPVQ